MTDKTILVVDDSRVSRMMVKSMIGELKPGAKIIEAEDAEDALKLLESHSVDYFSVDLNMPGMNGLELIEKLKPDNTNSKFALLTANIQEATHKHCQSLGVACINKPITEESVTQMLEYFYE